MIRVLAHASCLNAFGFCGVARAGFGVNLACKGASGGLTSLISTMTALRCGSLTESSQSSLTSHSSALSDVQQQLSSLGLDAYLVPSTDPHLTEYPPVVYRHLPFVSGFTGSAGCAVITQHKPRPRSPANANANTNANANANANSSNQNVKSFLVTDGRYELQGVGECGDALDVVISARGAELGALDEVEKKLLKNEALGGCVKIGLDPSLSSTKFCESLIALVNRTNIGRENTNRRTEIVFTDPKCNLLSTARGPDAPLRPANRFVVMEENVAGRSVGDKLQDIKSAMKEKVSSNDNDAAGAPSDHTTPTISLIITNLDEIGYLLNLRTDPGDIEFYRLGISYCKIDYNNNNNSSSSSSSSSDELSVTLYADEEKFSSSEVKAHLIHNGIITKSYDALIDSDLRSLNKQHLVWVDKSNCNYAVTLSILSNNHTPNNKKVKIIDMPTPLNLMKAQKNSYELNEFRQCHVQDGAAYANFASKLFKTVIEEGTDLREEQVGDLVDNARRSFDKGIKDLSFPSIVGVGSNGAIVHYNYKTAPPGVKMGTLTSSKEKAGQESYSSSVLIDSGAHYNGGTTDVTRTWYLGDMKSNPPSDFLVQKYTQVLRGMINLR